MPFMMSRDPFNPADIKAEETTRRESTERYMRRVKKSIAYVMAAKLWKSSWMQPDFIDRLSTQTRFQWLTPKDAAVSDSHCSIS